MAATVVQTPKALARVSTETGDTFTRTGGLITSALATALRDLLIQQSFELALLCLSLGAEETQMVVEWQGFVCD